jgi:hypothetical protein
MITTSANASKSIAVLLSGAQLDTLRVYSVALCLGFVRLGASDQRPNEVWVVLSGDISVHDASGKSQRANEFLARRENAVAALYRLIGQEVVSAQVCESGQLKIFFEQGEVVVERGEADLEEVWGVMSDSPNPADEHQWHVCFDDSGRFLLKEPIST